MFGITPPTTTQNVASKSSNTKAGSQTITKKTLDIQHNNKMQQFQDKEVAASKLQEDIESYKKQIENIYQKRKNSDGELSDEDVNYLIELKDILMSLEKQLESLENTNEIDYLVNTGDILFKYYDIIDKGSPQEESILINKKNMVDNSILKYLLKSKADSDSQAEESSSPKKGRDKASLLEKYLEFTEHNYVKQVWDGRCSANNDKCSYCSSCNRNIMLNDGIIYCNDCFTVEYIIIDHDRPSYKDPPKEISYFAYKRINHFNEFKLLGIIRYCLLVVRCLRSL